MKCRRLLLIVGVLLLTAGCGRRLPTAPASSSLVPAESQGGSIAAKAPAVVQGPRVVEGRIGPGALYALFVPENWNGDLIVYAHGYVESPKGIELPAIAYLRDPLLAQGYAVAYSSFSSNGYALKEGVQQTHQLRGLFVSNFGSPNRTFVVGQSLGGIIGLKLVEKYPQQYAGALLGCGVVGGTRHEIGYIANVRVLFDYFYPGVLPGTLLSIPPGTDFNALIPRIVGAILANPGGAGAMAQILPIPFANPQELVQAIVSALGFQILGAGDFLDRAHGHVFFDNSHVVYSGPGLPQALLDDLNARVARYTATPDAENFMRHDYEPSGDLRIPVLTVHTTRDPIVPIFNEGLFHDSVAAAGRLDFLVQRRVDTFGHCAYAVSDLLTGFADLVRWVDTGVKPAL